MSNCVNCLNIEKSVGQTECTFHTANHAHAHRRVHVDMVQSHRAEYLNWSLVTDCDGRNTTGHTERKLKATQTELEGIQTAQTSAKNCVLNQVALTQTLFRWVYWLDSLIHMIETASFGTQLSIEKPDNNESLTANQKLKNATKANIFKTKTELIRCPVTASGNEINQASSHAVQCKTALCYDYVQ